MTANGGDMDGTHNQTRVHDSPMVGLSKTQLWIGGVLLAVSATAAIIAALRPDPGPVTIGLFGQGIGQPSASASNPWLDYHPPSCASSTVAELLLGVESEAGNSLKTSQPTASHRLLIRYFVLACMDEPRNRKTSGDSLCNAHAEAAKDDADWSEVVRHLEAADS